MLLWAVIAAALVLAVAGTLRLLLELVDEDLFMRAMHGLRSKDDFHRMRMLCDAAGNRGMIAVARAALGLRLEAHELSSEEGGYRAAPQSIPFEDRVRAAILPTAEAARTRAQRLLTLALAGGALGVATLVLRRFALDVLTLGALASAVVGAAGLHYHRRTRRGIDRALLEMPSLVLPGEQMHQPPPPRDPPRSPSPTPAPSAVIPSGSLVLLVEDPAGNTTERSFTEDTVKIGRAPSATLQLDDAGVTRIHAVIDRSPERARLVDLGAAEATRVNGAAIRHHDLEPGDVIQIGAHRVVVRTLRAP